MVFWVVSTYVKKKSLKQEKNIAVKKKVSINLIFFLYL